MEFIIFKKRPAGQAIFEYGLVLALLVIVVIVALARYGITLRDSYCTVVSGLGGDFCKHYCLDDFDDAKGWTQLNKDSWKISNRQMCNSSSNEQRIYNSCSSQNKLTDYSVNLTDTQLIQGNGYGIFVRLASTEPTNGIVFQYDPGLSGYVFRKWINGWEVNPALAFKAMPGYQWYSKAHDITVIVKGNTYTAYVDGEAVLSATDNTYSSGSVGLRTWDSTKMCTGGLSVDPLP
jgi:hypothetical protein